MFGRKRKKCNCSCSNSQPDSIEIDCNPGFEERIEAASKTLEFRNGVKAATDGLTVDHCPFNATPHSAYTGKERERMNWLRGFYSIQYAG